MNVFVIDMMICVHNIILSMWVTMRYEYLRAMMEFLLPPQHRPLSQNQFLFFIFVVRYSDKLRTA